MKKNKITIHIISQEIFSYSLITYLILYVLETLKKESISFFFDSNVVLGIVILSGIIQIITSHSNQGLQKRGVVMKTILSLVVTLGGSWFVFFIMQPFETVATILTITAGIFLFIFSFIFLGGIKENPRA